jgi:hypothetical protein
MVNEGRSDIALSYVKKTMIAIAKIPDLQLKLTTTLIGTLKATDILQLIK